MLAYVVRRLWQFVPTLLGVVPKTLVAYTGTYVVGESARYYYRFGRKPPPEVIAQLRDEGARLAQQALTRLQRR